MPPEHYLVLLHLVFSVNVGGVAMREIYDFMDDLKFHKLGQQVCMVAAITVTEFLIVIKYDPCTITLPLPFYVALCWILATERHRTDMLRSKKTRRMSVNAGPPRACSHA
ncbi:unnamed protein product [Ranitomeya imitator]|uniref:Phosphatidylserine synthase n=1 Tax=Ranitomeya imitator TaxID=111125 RepID=A0ABN9L478_9NEOB|nr:unnamed protein product [Ranitomeya imitator]